MKSEWRVTSNIINGETKFGVYRLLDTKETDHSGNREYQSLWTADRKVAEGLAGTLNLTDRHERLDAWLTENCDEYLGDGKCELSCTYKKWTCCFTGCERAAQCRAEEVICDGIDLPKEFKEEGTE